MSESRIPQHASPQTVAPIVSVLQRMGAPPALAPGLHRALGATAAEDLTANPWLLLRLPGVTVEQADHAAQHLAGQSGPVRPEDPRRRAALVQHVLVRATRQGHTALPQEQVSAQLRGHGVTSPEAAVQEALDRNLVTARSHSDEDIDAGTDAAEAADTPEDDSAVEAEAPTDQDRTYLALPELAASEDQLASGINRLIATSEPIMDPFTARETVAATATRLSVDIAPEVEAALITVALRGVSIVTHAAHMPAQVQFIAGAADIAHAGGGRTTVVTPLAASARALAESLPDDVPVSVYPLAQLLDPEPSAPASPGGTAAVPTAASPALAADLVIVADAMAVDTTTAAELVTACADGTHLVLLADPHERFAPGPGQVVPDLRASGIVPVAELGTPDAPQPLARVALEMLAGRVPAEPSPGHEVVPVTVTSPAEATHRTLQLLTDSIPRAFGVDPDDTLVVTVARSGSCGAEALNAACKAQLNPGPGACWGFDVGDRVVQVRATEGRAAGERGTVHECADTGVWVRWDRAGSSPSETAGPVFVEDSTLLRHGWAFPTSVAHGGRWPAVIAVVDPTPGTGPLPPDLAYTMLTRAQLHVSLVWGADPLVTAGTGVTAAPGGRRHTRLVPAVREG
ncbi:helix-hairpin-helix domain-containing protein [Lipingzhangella sp. LS1_29]|uniref:Helix-hairpin-helix domain-containing protein n=1 Tax=Lipingzhangella rawalii TaxID=2055835 RepID=A0ABU2H231_9ACTN|nr:helix-hairpin-helix domain-containing protein [Lipingzhangella rawalii]MDS1268920.1 helix-hairpin-helix domain-containing protein [Lipingzhangella rawalii]